MSPYRPTLALCMYVCTNFILVPLLAITVHPWHRLQPSTIHTSSTHPPVVKVCTHSPLVSTHSSSTVPLSHHSSPVIHSFFTSACSFILQPCMHLGSTFHPYTAHPSLSLIPSHSLFYTSIQSYITPSACPLIPHL